MTELPLSGWPPEDWVDAFGVHWVYFRQYREWHGFFPGEDGLWIDTESEFRQRYPEAPIPTTD